MTRSRILLITITLLSLLPITSLAFQAEQKLSDSRQEKRAHNIFDQLRCVVCNSQSLNSSNAPIAKHMRQLVRDKIRSNNTNEQIIQYLVSKYGEEVLLKPKLNSWNYILWLVPFVFLFAGLYFLLQKLGR